MIEFFWKCLISETRPTFLKRWCVRFNFLWEIQCISPVVELHCYLLCQGPLRKYFFIFHSDERGNYFQLPNEHEVSEENTEQNILKVDSTGEESLQHGQPPTQELWGSKKHSVISRRDLQTLCCTTGCSMADLSALCWDEQIPNEWQSFSMCLITVLYCPVQHLCCMIKIMAFGKAINIFS